MTDKNKMFTASNPDDQWRVDNARHLAGEKLHKRNYQRYSKAWDHDHCAACMTKFAEFDAPDVQHVGYATGDGYKFGANYEWVCPQCFVELKPVLGWTADDASS